EDMVYSTGKVPATTLRDAGGLREVYSTAPFHLGPTRCRPPAHQSCGTRSATGMSQMPNRNPAGCWMAQPTSTAVQRVCVHLNSIGASRASRSFRLESNIRPLDAASEPNAAHSDQANTQ